MSAKLAPHRRKNPNRCVRCAASHRSVPASWNLDRPGHRTMYLCDTHAEWWAGQEGIPYPPRKESE